MEANPHGPTMHTHDNMEGKIKLALPDFKHVLVSSPHRQVTSRFFFSLFTILIVAIGYNATESIMRYLIVKGGVLAHLSSTVLLVSAVLAFLDVFLNDILPAKYSFIVNRRWRHYLWGSIGVTYFGYAFILVKLHFSFWVYAVYVLLGLWALTIAVMDAVYEYNEKRERQDAEE